MENNKIILESNFTYINYIKSPVFRLILFVGIVVIFGIVNIDKIMNVFIDKNQNILVGVYNTG